MIFILAGLIGIGVFSNFIKELHPPYFAISGFILLISFAGGSFNVSSIIRTFEVVDTEQTYTLEIELSGSEKEKALLISESGGQYVFQKLVYPALLVEGAYWWPAGYKLDEKIKWIVTPVKSKGE